MSFQIYSPTKIHFGVNEIDSLASIAHPYGDTCTLVTTKNEKPLSDLYDRLKTILKRDGITCYHFDEVSVNPSTSSIEMANEFMRTHKSDFIIAVGGGSSMDTAKMMAFTYKMQTIDWNMLFSKYNRPFGNSVSSQHDTLPIVAITTTSGTGSQVTQCAVVSIDDRKHGIFHDSMFPKEAIIDPTLMLTLPNSITASSGFDAFCHACETYLKPTTNPFIQLLASEAMRTIACTLPKAINDPSNITYRNKLALADLLAGISLSNLGGYIAHPVGEYIGSIVPMNHGQTLAYIYPAYIETVKSVNPKGVADVARFLNQNLIGIDDATAADACVNELKVFLKNISMEVDISKFSMNTETVRKAINKKPIGEIAFADQNQINRIIEMTLDQQ